MNTSHFTLQNSIQYLQEYKDIQLFTEIKLTDHNNNRYIYPVLTFHCRHIKFAINLETVLDAINRSGYFTCECNNTVCHPNQLQKDIRWGVNEEINEIFDYGLVIHNQLFHNFKRATKYNAAISDKISLPNLKTLLEQQNSININQIFQRMSQNVQNQKNIFFKAICLLDFVLVNIPVRFNGCQHPECYDLASLLVYCNENSINQSQADQLQQFKCKQRLCQVKVDISTVQKIFNNIYIDKELLKMIKRGLPSIYKYQYHPNTLQIQQDSIIRDEVIVDPQIYQSYIQQVKQQVSASSQAYQEYQKQVILIVYTILQRTSIVQTELKLELFKYKTFEIPAMNEKIEQPARCINCHISQVMELKQLISIFQSQKFLNKQQIKPLKCPLCEKKFNYNIFIPNAIYFDKNLFDALEQGLLEKVDQIYMYNGKKLMKEEFISKQKLELVEFKQHLQNEYQNQTFTFTQLYCCSNPAIPISLPLILKKCPEQKIVDFESFYNRIQQLEANNYEEQCLKFCNCSYCSNNPFSFKKFPFHVYFHEAFFIALTEFNKSKSNKKPYQFTYDFQSNRIIEEQVQSLKSKRSPISEESFNNQGFNNLLDDKEYQEKYQKKKYEGYEFQIISNEISTTQANLYNNKNGYDSSNNLKELNQKISNNEIAKKYLPQITEMNIQFNGSFIQLAKGNVNLKYM